MKKIQIHQVDAFTNEVFGGNPAGVVFAADHLSDDEMKNIAREMNLSETAFVLKPTKPDADVKLRYFTSGKAEAKFCGHATIGTLYELGRAGLFGTERSESYHLRVETNAGILPMEIVKKSAIDISVKFSAPPVSLEHYKSQHIDFAERFFIAVESIAHKYPIIIDRNLNYLYLTVPSLKKLGELEFNFQHIINNFKDEGIGVFCLLTPETFNKTNHIHARGLAPIWGVNEDPVTGSMQAGLATYARFHGIIPSDITTIRTEQGNFIGRPGFVEITILGGEFFIIGHAAHVFSTEIAF